jgi:hypothetical protein
VQLWVIGAVLGIAGWALFIRMAVELNRALPPGKRLPLIRFRENLDHIKRLHGDYFPNSVVRLWAFLLIAASASLSATGVIVGVIAGSKHW